MNKNIIPILIVIGLLGCTGNSIFDDEISSLDGYSFHGIVKIAGSSDAENVYIWLEAFNIGAWSDSTGAFELHIPPAKTQSGEGLTGEYRVFYYIANYGIKISKIYVQNGKIIYDKLSLDNTGAIRDEIVLSRILEISTRTDSVIYPEFSGQIPITVTLKNEIDTVEIECLSIYSDVFDGLFFQSDTVPLDKAIPVSYSQLKKTYQILRPTELVMIFWISKFRFNPGNYYIIPYLYIHQKDLPIELLQSISVDYLTFGTEYLKLPFRRKNGILKVLPQKPDDFD